MATPAKNFTDPTGLCAMTPPVSIVQPVPPRLGMTAVAHLPNVWSRWAMVLPGVMMRPLTAGMIPRIPTPPMGRQVVLTFPPIYRERSGDSSPSTGQLYPPPAP